MRTAIWLGFLMLPMAAAQAQVPLSHGVPHDMHFLVHGMTSTTPDPGSLRFERAVQMLADSGIHEDVIELATIDMSPRDRAQVRGTMEHVCGLLGRVDWQLLCEREVVFAYRMSLPIPEYMAIFRVPEARIEQQIVAIREMLGGFAELAEQPPDTVREVERQTGKLTVFEVPGVPVQFACGDVGDALVFATSTRLASAAMRLLTQGEAARSLGASERFRAGLEELPHPTENVLFVDVHGLMDFYQQALRMAMVAIGRKGEHARQERAVLAMLTGIIDELDVVDHILATTQCDGRTTTSTTRIELVPDFESTEMAAVVGGQKPWTDWYRRVPADALDFGFDAGMNFGALYDLVMERMRDSDHFDALLCEHHAGVEAVRDTLAHVSGELAWVTLPTNDSNGCLSVDTVCFVRLEDPDAVANLLPGWLDEASKFLASREQKMAVVSHHGIHELKIAALPWIRPTIGVRDDELVFATSGAALARIDRVRDGRAPDIRERVDFTSLGLGDRDAVEALAFGRMASGMGSFADLLGTAGFALSILPQDCESSGLLTIGTILTKLAPACRELDFGYDWAMEAMPGKAPNTWITRSVYRYHNQQ